MRNLTVSRAGAWEILAPFILGYSGFVTPTTNAIIVGLIVAPFILAYGNRARANDIIVGFVIAEPHPDRFSAGGRVIPDTRYSLHH
ncbi:MAG TPA: SPW repeat protein [Chloroflexota bacterium]|nr:SPW repeat protein [Chloroflexota bacterium]